MTIARMKTLSVTNIEMSQYTLFCTYTAYKIVDIVSIIDCKISHQICDREASSTWKSLKFLNLLAKSVEYERPIPNTGMTKHCSISLISQSSMFTKEYTEVARVMQNVSKM